MGSLRPTRVLAYAPYNRWALHGQWEMTILHTLRLRGAEVRYVLCDGLFSECDQFWAAHNPRPADACLGCQADVTKLCAEMGMDYRWLGRHLTPDEGREARRWAESVATEDLLSATYGKWPIAAWVRMSLQSHFRAAEPDVGDPAVERAVRGYLHSGLVAAFALDRLLADSDPDVLLLFNGRQSSLRVALELARARGIRVVTHERGQRPETLMLVENATVLALERVRRYWREWGDVPLCAEEVAAASRLMIDREHGRDLPWKPLSAPPQPAAEVRARLGLHPQRPVWVLFTSSDDEVAGDEDWGSAFASQRAWIDRTIAYAAAHPELDLVIRVHPNTGSKRSTGANHAQLAEMATLREGLPPHVSLIEPDDDVSAYSLMDLCTVGLVWVSTAGLELACKGKATVAAAGSPYSHAGFVRAVTDPDAYETLLDELATLAPDTTSAEIRRAALRFAYGYFFRLAIAFPLVRMPDVHNGVLAYSSLEELLPGRDAGLDRCARILLEGEAVCPPPTEAELGRGTDAEDALLQGFGVPAGNELTGDPAVSVVITCFNYGRYLADSIGSVLAQTLTDFELIVVDDGSTDDSVAIARRLAAGDPRVTVIAQEGSGQPAIPRNRAVGLARGRYVVCLDADDRLHPEMLARCAAVLDADPAVALAFPQTAEFGDSDELHPHLEWSLEKLIRCNCLPCCTMYRRDAWVAAGGYNTNVRGYEDWDLWLGIAATGAIGRPARGALWHYRKHGAGVYSESTGDDQRLKAQVVVNRPQLFSDTQVAWARGVLTGDPAALAITAPLGHPPVFDDPPRTPVLTIDAMRRAGQEEIRRVAVLAYGDELLADPALLSAYGSAVSATDDITLVIATAGGDVAPLLDAVAGAGLDGDGSPDMIAVPAAPYGVDAVLSRRKHAGIARYDETTLPSLRALAV
jgi:hypothetical protein